MQTNLIQHSDCAIDLSGNMGPAATIHQGPSESTQQSDELGTRHFLQRSLFLILLVPAVGPSLISGKIEGKPVELWMVAAQKNPLVRTKKHEKKHLNNHQKTVK